MVFWGMLVYYCDTPDRTDAPSASAVSKGADCCRSWGQPWPMVTPTPIHAQERHRNRSRRGRGGGGL